MKTNLMSKVVSFNNKLNNNQPKLTLKDMEELELRSQHDTVTSNNEQYFETMSAANSPTSRGRKKGKKKPKQVETFVPEYKTLDLEKPMKYKDNLDEEHFVNLRSFVEKKIK